MRKALPRVPALNPIDPLVLAEMHEKALDAENDRLRAENSLLRRALALLAEALGVKV